MIIKDIAQYEDSDSQLAKNTICELHKRIRILELDNESLMKEIKALKFDKIQEYIIFDCSESDKRKKENKEKLKVVEDIKKIMRR